MEQPCTCLTDDVCSRHDPADVAGPYSIGSDCWPGTAKTIEECGELQQVLGKLIACGGKASHWDGTNLRERLGDELADALAAIEFFIEENDVEENYIRARAARKLDRYRQWQREHAGREQPERRRGSTTTRGTT